MTWICWWTGLTEANDVQIYSPTVIAPHLPIHPIYTIAWTMETRLEYLLNATTTLEARSKKYGVSFIVELRRRSAI